MSGNEVVLVRHGETEWSASGQHTGTTDIPLTDEGRRHAEALGARLVGWRFARVLSSPLSRALDTCRLAGLGDGAEVTGDLREWDYGEYEGRRTVEIREERPGWDLWVDGVPGGETVEEVGRRADRVIAAARDTDGPVALFAHGHLLRVLAARWIGLPPDHGRLLALSTASISVLGWERETAVVQRWNQTADE
ncbi:MAG: histidine phosphatase family protein [Actinomycetota bacterium]|nr:histidine phosphatase family protein [Actinomycetota bacterium]